MGNKIIITGYKNSILTCMTDGKRVLQLNFDPTGAEQIYGNIYVGKVRNIVSNINAAFVEIANGKMCYLSLQKCTDPIFIQHGKQSDIRVGDELLVQVDRDEVKTKAPTVTTTLNLTGKYLVLNNSRPTIAVSSKIEDPLVRKHLKALLAPYQTDSCGFIIRTNAMLTDDECILKEAVRLQEIYRDILTRSRHIACFSLIYKAIPAFLCTIRDSYSDTVEEFLTDDPDIYEQINDYLKEYQPEDLNKLKKYTNTAVSLDAAYSLSTSIERAVHEKIWLKSGGSIIIQPTEALTAIDVNTEKAVKTKGNTQEMFYHINQEAAEEIAYQLRLRNISGIIIVDFIDMTDGPARKKLMEHLEELVKLDPVKTTVVDMTALNLIELTRKKTRKPVLEQLKNI